MGARVTWGRQHLGGWSTYDGVVTFYREEEGWICFIKDRRALDALGIGESCLRIDLEEGTSRRSLLVELDEHIDCGTRLRLDEGGYLFRVSNAAVCIRRSGRSWRLHDVQCSSEADLHGLFRSSDIDLSDDCGAADPRYMEYLRRISVLRTGPFADRRFPNRDALVAAVEEEVAAIEEEIAGRSHGGASSPHPSKA